MITCKRIHLLSRCLQRGYTLEEVRPCIVSEGGDEVTVDVDHPSYPRESRRLPRVKLGYGPGTELKKLLKSFGITAAPGCACNRRAEIMDNEEHKSPGWCAAHMDEIVGWLREEATKRNLPFVDIAGRTLVNLAIRRAKKGSKK